MIEEIKYWDVDLESGPGFDYDVQSSFSQFSRIFSRPLVTDDLIQNSSFTSWRGRLVSLLYLGKTLISELFELVKNVIVLIYITALTALEALNFAFSSSAKEEFFVLLGVLIGSSFGLAMRPIAFISNGLLLAGGALIHPALSIGAKTVY